MPAAALGVYTGAVGQVFSSIKNHLDAHAGMNASQTATLLGVAKLQRCQQAIAVNNLALVKLGKHC